jgi:hypothetical protein
MKHHGAPLSVTEIALLSRPFNEDSFTSVYVDNVRTSQETHLWLSTACDGNSFIFLLRMVSSGLLRRVALVRTDVSEETGASFIRMTKVGELGTTQVATSNRLTLRRNTNILFLVHRLLSPWWRRRQVPPKRRFLQKPQGLTSQKTPFFIVTAVKTSNLTYFFILSFLCDAAIRVS